MSTFAFVLSLLSPEAAAALLHLTGKWREKVASTLTELCDLVGDMHGIRVVWEPAHIAELDVKTLAEYDPREEVMKLRVGAGFITSLALTLAAVCEAREELPEDIRRRAVLMPSLSLLAWALNIYYRFYPPDVYAKLGELFLAARRALEKILDKIDEDTAGLLALQANSLIAIVDALESDSMLFYDQTPSIVLQFVTEEQLARATESICVCDIGYLVELARELIEKVRREQPDLFRRRLDLVLRTAEEAANIAETIARVVEKFDRSAAEQLYRKIREVRELLKKYKAT